MYELDISHIAGGKIGERQSAAKLSAQVTGYRVSEKKTVVSPRTACLLGSTATMAECCLGVSNGLKKPGC